jgi:hypothetical protein
LKLNLIGIVGVILAFIGLVLPWWTMTFSMTLQTTLSYTASIYLYQTTASGIGMTITNVINLWYGWVAFTLLVLGALLGIAGSLMTRARMILILGGILALLSVIVFVAGLQNDLSSTSGLSGIGLFSSGSYSSFSYMTYLSYGFWIALVGAILMLIASVIKPKVAAPPTPPPSPPTPPT